MAVKYINYFLILVLLTLITAIVVVEIKYERYNRFDWRIYTKIDNKTEPIHIIEGTLSNKENDVRIHKDNNPNKLIYNGSSLLGYYYDRNLPPDSINFVWFSYKKDRFYKIKKAIDKQKIKEYIGSKKIENYALVLNLTNTTQLDIFIKEDPFSQDSILINSFEGKQHNLDWKLNNDRETSVFLMNSKVVMTPKVIMQDESKFVELRTYLVNQSGIHYGSLKNDALTTFDPRRKQSINRFSLKLKNETGNSQLHVSLSTAELVEKLKKLTDTVSLSIHVNALDSIENIRISDSKQLFQLKKYKVVH